MSLHNTSRKLALAQRIRAHTIARSLFPSPHNEINGLTSDVLAINANRDDSELTNPTFFVFILYLISK
jgi:hypothetical protein